VTRLLALSVGTGFLAACGTGPGACTLDVQPGIVVEIRDAFDDAPLAEHARGSARDGEFVDSLQPYGSVANGTLISRAGAYERAGDYTVTVEHDGYFADGELQRAPPSSPVRRARPGGRPARPCSGSAPLGLRPRVD